MIMKWGQRHNLPLLNIFTIDAAINANGPDAYQGMDRYAARRQIVKDLQSLDLIEKIEEHTHMVPCGDRSGAVIEPYLTDQWYVKIQPLAAPAIAAVENGAIRFVPDSWSKTYFEWMQNLNDWCISRQLWWGHRIPAWYDADGNIYVGKDETHVRKKYQLDDAIGLTRDVNVLDTWFSSALWPFSSLGWPEQTAELQRFYPTSVLVTGFDIIFFWVARMIMMGLKFMGEVPFTEVYVTGLVRDSEGQKMSKSKGNIMDPLDLIDGIELDTLVAKQTANLMQPQLQTKIEKATRRHFPDGIPAFGTDALRFTFAQLATQGRDIRFDTGRIQGYRNFCNKLWNAARYVMMCVAEQDVDVNIGTVQLGSAERWIGTRLGQARDRVTRGIADYRFDLAAQALYEFTWDEYCDWYVELSKTTLSDPGLPIMQKRGVLQTLLSNLEILLRLLHPFIPFITEELWQKVAPLLNRRGETIMLQPYPNGQELPRDESACAEIDWLRSFILGVRRIRSERDIAPGKLLVVQVKDGVEQEHDWLQQNRNYIRTLAKVSVITRVAREPDDAVAAQAGSMTILVPLADLIDPKAEAQKLEKQLEKLDNDRQRIGNKLENKNFIGKAPAEIVQKERDKLAKLDTDVARLTAQLERIRKLLE